MSLSDQLKSLQIPGQAAIQQYLSIKHSILFDAQTSATLDNDTILEIGITGFSNLCSIDFVFKQFEDLFTRSALNVQRNMENNDFNRRLSKKLSMFLMFLSPYVLLKPAHRCLEWLVRKFQIHIHEKNALIACLLPYHETQFFGRVVQLFGELESDQLWFFLQPFKQSGTGFSTNTLVQHCIKNEGMLRFVHDMTIQSAELLKYGPKSGFRTIFSFHARLFISVIDSKSSIKNKFLSYILTLVTSSLKIHHKDLVCSLYMIVGLISSKVNLTSYVTKSLLQAIFQSLETDWYEEGLLCVLSVVIHQKLEKISSRITKLFVSLDLTRLMQVLNHLNKEHDIEVLINLLVVCICKSCFSSGDDEEKFIKALHLMVDNEILVERHVKIVARKLISALLLSEDQIKDFQKTESLLRKFAKRFSSVFDETIALFFKESSGNQKSIDILKQLSIICLSSGHRKIVQGAELPIILGLNHPEPNIRIDAVHHLLKGFESTDYDENEMEFMKDAILARLKDDSINVVNSVLKYSKSLSKILSAKDLQELSISLMSKTGLHFDEEIVIYTIETLDGNSSESKFVYTLLVHIFNGLVEIKSKKFLEYFKTTNIKLGHPILKGIQKGLASIDLQKANHKSSVLAYHDLLLNIAREISDSPGGLNVILNLWEFCKDLPFVHSLQFVVILLFNEIVLLKSSLLEGFVNEVFQMNFKRFFRMDLSEELLHSMEGFKNTEKEKNYLYKSFYNQLKQNEFENDAVLLPFLIFFKNLTTITPKGHNTEVLFSVLATQSGNKRASLKIYFQMLLNRFLKEKFNSKSDLLSFLCNVSLNALKDNVVEEKLKSAICALHILNALLTNNDYDLIEKNNVTQVSHALFLCKHPKIRETVLQINKVLYEIVKQEKKNPWNNILLKVIEAEKEIFMDSLYIKRIYQALFNTKKIDDFASLIKKSKKSTISFITKKLTSYPILLQLNILKVLENVNPEDCIDDYVDVLSIILQFEKLTDCQVEIVKIIVNTIKPKQINEKKNILDLFCKCLSSSNEVLQDMTCGLLTESLYSELSSENRRTLLKELLRIILSTSSVSTATKMRIVLKSINISSTDINELLDKIYHDLDIKENFVEDLPDSFTKSLFWRQLVEILESISCKNKIDQPEILIAPLFNIFNKCLIIKNTSIEYVKQLLLTIFTYIISQGVLNISPDLFKIDLVIQCLQESKDFQTTRHCLVLLGKSAQHYPSQVLHNIMHIFTFMGGTMLKIDNQQTFKLIENTIDAIVPMLVQKSPEVTESRKRPSPTNIDVIILFILETFIDSAPHCPEHRRQHILSHLIKVLNEDCTLHTAMVLLIKKTIQDAQKVVVDDSFKEIQPASITLDFCKDFFMHYPSDVQLHSLCQVIAYLKEPTEEQIKKSKDGNKQIKVLTYAVIKFVTEVLASATMQELYVVEDSKYTPLIIALLEELLSYVEALGIKNLENQKDKKYINNLIQKVYDAVGLLTKILPFDSFVAVISGLINKDSLLIRKKALEMLCAKLSELENVQKNQEKPLLNLYSSIVVLVQHNSDNIESPTNKQLMLYAMKLLAAHLCQKNKEIFLKSVPIVSQVYCVKETNNLVAINAILCVAELSSHLKAAMLPYLPIFFKPILEKIKKEGDYQSNDLTLIGCTTAIQKIIASMPEFMSSFVPKILETISISGYLAERLSCNQLMEKVNDLKKNCGHLIPPRVLYPALEIWFHDNLVSNKNLVSSIIDVLRHSFSVISKVDANTNFQGTILKILKMLFDVHSFETDDIEVNIEKKSIAAYCELVLKLSENTLRPMYLEIYNWSCEEEGRLCTFFHLNVELSKTLKSLFLIFFGHALKKCTELLITLNSKNTDTTGSKRNKNLTEAVLDVLSNVFKYDNQGFVNKERFDSIMQPLVDQLDNSLFSDEAFTLFSGEHLIPCIVNFTCAVNDSSLWKPLNHQILLKTKSSQANVRLAALQVIENIYSRIGESYMILVPETIPFLAEVLEDDSFEVEVQCKKVIKQIEIITGESLQKYF